MTDVESVPNEAIENAPSTRSIGSVSNPRDEIARRPGAKSIKRTVQPTFVPRKMSAGLGSGRSSDSRAGTSGLLIGAVPNTETEPTMAMKRGGRSLKSLTHSGGAVPDSHRVPCSFGHRELTSREAEHPNPG